MQANENKLTAKRVREVLLDCMFKGNPEPGTKFIPAIGISNKFGFDPEKIKLHENDIEELLSQLSFKFKENDGGGSSLIEVPFTANREQWGEQKNGDELMVLGMAIGRVKYTLENRSLWCILPGSVPYYTILDEKQEVECMEV